MRSAKKHRWHFVSRWTVDAPPDAIYEVVRYPTGWPEVKDARRLDVAENNTRHANAGSSNRLDAERTTSSSADQSGARLEPVPMLGRC